MNPTEQTAWRALSADEAIPLGMLPWPLLGGLIFFIAVEAEKAIIRAASSREPAVVAPRTA